MRNSVVLAAMAGLVAMMPGAVGEDFVVVDPDMIWLSGVTTTAAPENLTSTEVAGANELAWDLPAFLDSEQMTLIGYRIVRVPGSSALAPVSEFLITDPDQLTFSDTTIASPNHYLYYVTAIYAEDGVVVTDTTESLPSNLAFTSNWPPCAIAGTYWHWPYVSVHPQCLFPLPP